MSDETIRNENAKALLVAAGYTVKDPTRCPRCGQTTPNEWGHLQLGPHAKHWGCDRS